MTRDIHGISSMATRALLAELAGRYGRESGVTVRFESVGGVDAARRVQAGEAFDLVVLASDAIDKLIASGHLQPGSRVDLVRSMVAVAVRADAPAPDISSEAALRQAVLAASRIGYSTGPSGTALLQLFARWGIADDIQPRLMQAPPGVPVAALVARGDVALGFQQLSELINVTGITVVGTLPPGCQIVTTFSAGVPVGVTAGSLKAAQVRALLDWLASPVTIEAKRQQGMEPA